MKKITFLLAATIFFVSAKTNAQEDAKRECLIKYNLFKGDFKSKKYDDAYPNWTYLMDNCQDLSVNIYKYGADIAQDVKKDPTLAKKVYEQRLQYFPEHDDVKNNLAKLHSDYATYLAENKLASETEIFNILEIAYKISPRDMSVKNIYKYFQGVTDKYKDIKPQKVFDTYDDVIESVGEKLDDYLKKIFELTKDSARVLGAKEKTRLRAYTINSKALGQVEGGLDNIISEIATCERLVPLYKRDFEENKNNEVWLKRAVSRMFYKGCQADPLYATLAKSYAEASPSPEAYSFLANVLEDNGDISGAAAMRQKSFDIETDPLKKAKYKLKFAQAAKARGQLSKARSLAREALKYNPNFGKAYLLIGRLYQSSVNDCGSNEFEKRMVYAAALRQAQRASAVDPSISSIARDYIRSYEANLPSKKVIFTEGRAIGESYSIKCWIGETVKVASSGK
ncbi:MAG: tetratricopeptide (TPR) repeat protein [Paraglaciecola sp.]|jgi:tetratricopeptide (TPR) repeat protein